MSDEPMQNRVRGSGANGGGGGGTNPASLSVDDMARLLSAGGQKKVTPLDIYADIDAGAPVGPDGRMNLVHYAAWLARAVQSDGAGGGGR